MKKLLLALLVCGTAIIAAGKAPAAASADCIYLRYYYYEYLGGPECGLTYQYCEGPSYHTGCQTPYYGIYGGCECP